MINLDRYQRHSLIDWFSQDELSKSKIAVVGCGAVGNEVAKNLALLGVGNVDLYDFDTIEIHNLTRSVLFRESDVGKYKADVVAERLRDLDPNISVNSFKNNVWESLTINQARKYNSIICCVDNFEARIKLNQLCYLLSIDFVNTGIDSRYSSVELFPFSQRKDIACYECNIPASVYERISERYSCGWLKRISYVERKIPSTILTSSLTGALAVSMGLRLESNVGLYEPKKILINSITGASSVINLTKNDSCQACNGKNKKVLIIDTINSIEGLLTNNFNANDKYITLFTSDPIITTCRCMTCKSEEEIIFDLASNYDTKIMNCSKCDNDSIEVIIRDSFNVEELLKKYKGRKMPCKFVYIDNKDEIILFNLEEKNE